jgi:hypothetical protein
MFFQERFIIWCITFTKKFNALVVSNSLECIYLNLGWVKTLSFFNRFHQSLKVPKTLSRIEIGSRSQTTRPTGRKN